MKFEIDQRVSRCIDGAGKYHKYGTIIKTYSCFGTEFGDYPELYNVQWDGGIVGHGYLPHGIIAITNAEK